MKLVKLLNLMNCLNKQEELIPKNETGKYLVEYEYDYGCENTEVV